VSEVLAHDWFPVPLPGSVVLGEGTWLYSAYAFRHFASTRPVAVRVGRRTGVYDGTFFDLGPEGEVVIGDACTVVGAVFATNGRVTLGDHVFIAHEVTFADTPFATPAPAAGPVRRGIQVGNTAWIGARAILLDGARVGDGAVVGAAAVVDFDVPPRAVVAGNPARVVGRT
jgi:acetyltransferase-like isoleucine patch superfamily enzyme